MPMEHIDKRSTPRVQYFLIHQVDTYVPVYVFRSESDESAIAALVTDISDGGVQILSTVNTTLDRERYDLELLRGAPDDVEQLHRAEVRRVWSRQEGIYTQSGFSFVDHGEPIPNLLERLAFSEHHLLRCVLHPLN